MLGDFGLESWLEPGHWYFPFHWFISIGFLESKMVTCSMGYGYLEWSHTKYSFESHSEIQTLSFPIQFFQRVKAPNSHSTGGPSPLESPRYLGSCTFQPHQDLRILCFQMLCLGHPYFLQFTLSQFHQLPLLSWTRRFHYYVIEIVFGTHDITDLKNRFLGRWCVWTASPYFSYRTFEYSSISKSFFLIPSSWGRLISELEPWPWNIILKPDDSPNPKLSFLGPLTFVFLVWPMPLYSELKMSGGWSVGPNFLQISYQQSIIELNFLQLPKPWSLEYPYQILYHCHYSSSSTYW